jgi:hypothetical protein
MAQVVGCLPSKREALYHQKKENWNIRNKESRRVQMQVNATDYLLKFGGLMWFSIYAEKILNIIIS